MDIPKKITPILTDLMKQKVFYMDDVFANSFDMHFNNFLLLLKIKHNLDIAMMYSQPYSFDVLVKKNDEYVFSIQLNAIFTKDNFWLVKDSIVSVDKKSGFDFSKLRNIKSDFRFTDLIQSQHIDAHYSHSALCDMYKHLSLVL